MKKKGFTLVELLGVISVLGITVLLVIPSVEKIIKESKEKALNNNKKTILAATKNWLSDNKNTIDGDEYIITVEDLKSTGYLEYNIKNPVSEKCIANDTEILITRDNDNFKYNFNGGILDGADSECEMVVTKANLYLQGKNPISVKQGDTFKDPGYTATNVKGDDISTKVTINGSVDTNAVGSYELVYSVEADGFITKKTRTVNVIDVEKPIINHPGTTVLLNSTSTYNVMDGVRAIDNSGDVINIKSTSNLTLGINGEYEVVYYATDKSGNEHIEKRRIIVREDTNTIYNKIKDDAGTIEGDYGTNLALENYELETTEFLKNYYRDKRMFVNGDAKNWVRIKNNLYRILDFSNDYVSLIYKKTCNNNTCEGNGSITNKTFYSYSSNLDNPVTKWESTKNEIKLEQEKWLKNQKIDKYLISTKRFLNHMFLISEVGLLNNYYEVIECQMNEDVCDMSSIMQKSLKAINDVDLIDMKTGIMTADVIVDYYILYNVGLNINNLLFEEPDAENAYINIIDTKIFERAYTFMGEGEHIDEAMLIAFTDQGQIYLSIASSNDIDNVPVKFQTIINVKPELTVSTGTGTEEDPYVLVP